ncbi:unnamed protein product [Ectocarpus sp. 12 AP-2014]
MLSTGQIDIAMSCIAALPQRFTMAAFSDPYMDLNLALIVPDHERESFDDIDAVRSRESLHVAMIGSHYFAARLHRYIPDATTVMIDDAEVFFRDPDLADALVLSAEEGAAYTFRYPHFAVVQPGGGARYPAAYAVPRGDEEMRSMISNWISLKQRDGTIDRLMKYWIYGGVTKPRTPRWSVVRDVLGWTD